MLTDDPSSKNKRTIPSNKHIHLKKKQQQRQFSEYVGKKWKANSHFFLFWGMQKSYGQKFQSVFIFEN